MREWASILAVPRFRRFWLALLTRNLGDWCAIASLPILVADRFGAGEELIVSLALRVLPKILLAPVAGDWLRRFGPARVASRSMLALGLMTALLPWCGNFLMLQIVIASVGVLDVFVTPGLLSLRNAVMPTGLEMAGNTLISVADRSAKFVGPALAGLILLAGFRTAFLLYALAYLAAAIVIAGTPTSLTAEPAGAGRRRASQLPLDFARMVRGDRQIAGLLVAAVTYMVMMGGLRPFLFWANRDWFGASDTAWTGLLAAQGAGALAGAVLAGLFSRGLIDRFGAYRLTLVTGMMEGGLLMSLVAVGGSGPAMLILALASMPELLSTATWFTAFQRRLPPHQQVVFFAFAAPLWDVAYITGVGLGGFYTAGLLPLSVYWVVVTASATFPLLPLLLLGTRPRAAGP